MTLWHNLRGFFGVRVNNYGTYFGPNIGFLSFLDPDVVTEKEEPKKVDKDDEFELPAGFDYDSMNLDYDNLGGEKKPEIKEEKGNEDGDDDELIVNYDEMDL